MSEFIDQHVIEAAVELRRRLHAHPELSGAETETARLIADDLHALDPDLLLTGLGGTGVAAVFSGKSAGPTVLFRAELDALPIEEINSFPHRSRQAAVSHKCGHDGHMAILLGLARIVAAHRPARGRIITLFQPAEETGEGAMAVLGDPRFAAITPDYAFALHNLPGYPPGAVIAKSGSFTAAVRSLIIRLSGYTSHAAEPENGVNPATAIGEILVGLEPFQHPDPASAGFSLITPVHVTMGEPAYGVAAGYGEVHLTIRCWTHAHMERLAGELESWSWQIARRHRLEIGQEWTNVFHPNTNDSGAVDIVREAAQQEDLLFLEPPAPMKWGEDFGAFTQRFPGALFGLGAGEVMPALHNPDYDFPDGLIAPGIALFFNIARRLLH